MDKHVVVLIGPPGCGKGTQGRLIANELQIPELSTGDMLRRQASTPTDLGGRIRTALDNGSLVDDSTMDAVLARRVAEPDCARGFILDGYPRTVCQARTLDRLLRRLRMPPPIVLCFDIDPEDLVHRLAARRLCPVCGRIYNLAYQPPADPDFCDDDGMILVRRSDDNPETVLARLRVYKELTSPVIEFYRDSNFHRINGVRPPGDVFEDIRRTIATSLAAAL